jgi:tetratricopeptide (TPR) repeat protein
MPSWWRRLGGRRPTADRDALARSATAGDGHGLRLFELGRHDEALAAFQEAAALYRRLAADDPARFELHLAGELNNVGMCLGTLRRYDQAIQPLEEAAAIIARWWEADQGPLGPLLAGTLASLAAVLGELAQHARAMELTDRVVVLRRASAGPAAPAVDSDLARALRQFAHVRANAGLELDRALPAATEAVTMYRQLARRQPAAFASELRDAETVLAAVAGPPQGTNWREQLHLLRLEAMEVPVLLREVGDAARAEAILRGADSRGDAAGARKLGSLLVAKKDLAGAEAAYRRADDRGDPDAPFYLGLLFHERGDLARAETAYRRGVERGSQLAAYNLGLVLKGRGDVAGARTAFERAATGGDQQLSADARQRLRELGGT